MKKNIKTFYNIKQRGTIGYQILFCFLLFFLIISNRGGGGVTVGTIDLSMSKMKYGIRLFSSLVVSFFFSFGKLPALVPKISLSGFYIFFRGKF